MFPITKTTSLTYPLESSIVYTDSYPFICVFLKLLRSALPTPFVPHSVFIVFNMTMIAYVSNVLFRKITRDHFYSIIAALFMLFAGPFIYRIRLHGGLSAHWLLIATFIPFFDADKKDRLPYLLCILFISIGTHSYLTGMIMPFIAAYALLGKKKWWRLGALSAFAAFSAYFWGYFIGNAHVGSSSFGNKHIDILVLLVPYGLTLFSFKDAPRGEFSYLCAGMVCMIPFAIKYIKNIRIDKRMLALFAATGICTSFAFINVVAFANIPLFKWPIPPEISELCGTFRYSTRFIWPLYYVFVIILLSSMHKVFKNRSTMHIVMPALFLLHVADMSPLIRSLHKIFSRKDPAFKIDNAQWNPVLSGCKHMRMPVCCSAANVPFDKTGRSATYDLAYIALINNMTINNFYFARRFPKIDNFDRETQKKFLSGQIDENTAYVMHPRMRPRGRKGTRVGKFVVYKK